MDFDKENHLYSLNGKNYQSVSSFLKKFQVPFAKERIAAAVAKREGLTAEEIIEKWELKGDASRDYGNAVHKGLEYWITYDEMSDIKHINTLTKKFAERYDRKNLRAEIVVYSEKYKISGTIDQIEVLGKKRINIIDVKTNAELIMKKVYNNLLPPLERFQQTKINIYRLQLSTYKALAEEMGLKVVHLYLEHWTGTKFVTIELEPIDVSPLFTYKKVEKKKVKINL